MSNKVAVVIPCHSHPAFFQEALCSVEAQTVPPDHTICVLDAPREMRVYTNSLADKHFTHVHRFKNNRGVSAARNAGFHIADEAGADWVICLDEDDLLYKYAIERYLQAHSFCPDVDVWYPDWVEFGEDPPIRRYVRVPEYSPEELARRPFIVCSAMIRLNVWKAVRERNGEGYDTELTSRGLRWEDYMLTLEIANLGFKMARVGHALLSVRRHGPSGTTIANQTIEEWKEYAEAKLERLYGPDS